VVWTQILDGLFLMRSAATSRREFVFRGDPDAKRFAVAGLSKIVFPDEGAWPIMRICAGPLREEESFRLVYSSMTPL